VAGALHVRAATSPPPQICVVNIVRDFYCTTTRHGQQPPSIALSVAGLRTDIDLNAIGEPW
jgi:hypothetical protein